MNRGKLQRGMLALAVLVGCVIAPVVAHAQSESEKKRQAKEHYEMASRFYDVGKYGEAIHEYEEAYLLVEDPALLFNIGQAYRLWDKPEDAIRSYKNYLRKRPEASNRADVEKKIADLERALDDRRRGATPAPQPAPTTVTVPPPVVQPPPPTNVASPNVEQPAPPLPAMVEPTPPQPGIDVSSGSVSPAVETSHPKWLAYSLLGVGGVGIVTAVIAGAIGASKAQKLKTASQNRDQFDPAVEANGKTANGVAAASGLVGMILGGTGGYLLWRWRDSATSVAVVPTYAGASASVTF